MANLTFENTNALKLWGKDIFELLYPDFPADQDPVIPQSREWSDIDGEMSKKPETTFPSEYISETMEKPHSFNGSNNWAVSFPVNLLQEMPYWRTIRISV